jgi:hypothetical protein
MSNLPANTESLLTAPEPKPVVYVGEDENLIAAALAPLRGSISLTCEEKVASVLMAAAQHRLHAVIVDLNKPDDARMLLVTALAAAKHPPRIVVLARRDDIGRFLRLPGVYCVIAYPLLPAQIRAAVADRRSKRRNNEQPREPAGLVNAEIPAAAEAGETPAPAALKSPEAEAKHAAWPGFRLYFLTAGHFMSVVSHLYKNAAFALLATLFTAFCFYGFLIAYFLLASSWGAPMTLTRGHQLVEKAVNDLSELQVTLSVNTQRHSEAELEAGKAKALYDDATVLVDFMKGTVGSEIAARTKQAGLARKNTARTEKLIKDFGSQTEISRADVRDLYKKRLITRKTYDALLMGSLEASQRLSMLEGEADAARAEVETLETSLDLLRTLKRQLDGQAAAGAASGSADLMLLTKEVVEARSSLDSATSQLASAAGRQKLLEANARLLRQRIAEIEQGALGRAVNGRIDVIFVPYGNEQNFRTGAPLYSCALTVLVCHKAGTVGATLPGESNAIHPFFGKPLRGFFVEAKLDDASAASEEIIHAGRPPFFF